MVNRIERNKVIAANSARRRLQMYFNFELLAQFQLEVHGGQPLPQNLAASAVARDAGWRRARLASRRLRPGRDDTRSYGRGIASTAARADGRHSHVAQPARGARATTALW